MRMWVTETLRTDGCPMVEKITLVDRGRGMQLSTSRITVMDLVPYFRRGCSYDEIIRWIPALTPPEIALVEAYYREHKDALDEQDDRLRESWEDRARQQRHRFPVPQGGQDERMTRLREMLRQRREGTNGQGTAGGH